MTNMMALGVLTGVGMFLFILIVAFFFVVSIALDAVEKRDMRREKGGDAEMEALRRRGESVLSSDEDEE